MRSNTGETETRGANQHDGGDRNRVARRAPDVQGRQALRQGYSRRIRRPTIGVATGLGLRIDPEHDLEDANVADRFRRALSARLVPAKS